MRETQQLQEKKIYIDGNVNAQCKIISQYEPTITPLIKKNIIEKNRDCTETARKYRRILTSEPMSKPSDAKQKGLFGEHISTVHFVTRANNFSVIVLFEQNRNIAQNDV